MEHTGWPSEPWVRSSGHAGRCTSCNVALALAGEYVLDESRRLLAAVAGVDEEKLNRNGIER